MDDRLVPVIAVLAMVGFGLLVSLFVHFIKPRREIGESEMFMPDPPRLEPRKTLPTLDEEEPPAPPVPATSTCLACGEPEADKIAVEDWEQVHRFWDRIGDGFLRDILRLLGVVRAKEHGRDLYQLRGYCRSCAAIAQPLHRAHREIQSVRRLAEDRQWEREGLPEAVREAVVEERERLKRARLKRGRLE